VTVYLEAGGFPSLRPGYPTNTWPRGQIYSARGRIEDPIGGQRLAGG